MRKRIAVLVCLLFSIIHPVFGQTQLIVNGGFELGSAPWTITGAGASIFNNGAGAFSGSYFLTMGNVSSVSQYAYQSITFPTNLIAASLSFELEVLTTDTSGNADSVLNAYLTDSNGVNLITNLGSESNLTPTTGYGLANFNLTTYTTQTNLSPYAGKTVYLVFAVTTAAVVGSQTEFNIDNVSMLGGTTSDIPSNDNFTNRIALTTDSATVSANTFCASKEPGEPSHAGDPGGHSVWWTWTPSTNGIAVINTTNSSFTTLLAVYTGSVVTNLTKITSDNGNNNGGGLAHVNFPFSAGTTYQIAVDGYKGAWGTAVLNLSTTRDTTAPTVKISSPASGANVTNSTIVVTGTASDNVAVAQVQYRLENANGTNAYQFATGSNSWSAAMTGLIPGPNTVQAQAIDTSGNVSATASVTFNYIVTAPLTLATNGSGTISGAANGALLDIGKSYTITAKAATGFKFVNWTGSQTTTNPALSFIMTSNLTFTANFVDDASPTLTVVAPKSGQSVSNATFVASGTAKDNVAVSNVLYQLNGGDWQTAPSGNNWSNWTANLTLNPGTNKFSVYAVDNTGNLSTTNTVNLVYILSATLTVNTNGNGTISPNDNGQLLAIGKSYTMTAKAASGFKFVNWTGSQTTTNPALTFMMQSNDTFTANFADNASPTLTVVAPKASQSVSNAAFVASGTAKDNVAVSNVFYQLNGGDWQMANTANKWTNWTANLTLTPGTNKFSAYAMDTTGNLSITNTASFIYILSATLTVNTNGEGTVSPNYNGQLLAIGKSYSMSAKAATGFKFVNWTGSQPTNNPTFSFIMQSNDTFTANFADDASPTLTVVAPKVGLSVTNAAFTATGTAKDNVAVQSVLYQLNGTGWQAATTANNWSNWTANLNLAAGTNKFSAYAVDTTGNLSATNSISFFYVLTATLTVNTNGEGTVSPNDNGALLEIGKSYTITAKAATGFKFVNWTGGQTSTNPALTFLMASNLTFTANFADAAIPTLTITSPKASQSISNVAANSMSMASGTARDNVAVSNVYYQLNGGSWNTANTFTSFSNWTANMNLSSGTNKFNAYAVDSTGNHSTTSSVSFVFVVLPDWAPDSVADLTGEVTPDPGFGAPFTITFGVDTFSKTGDTTNFDDFGVGDYSYLKTGTNTAQIFWTNTAPPSVSNEVTIANLMFTNFNSGTINNTINGDTGTFKFITAKTLVPVAVAGKTLTATQSAGNVTAKLSANGTFVSTSNSGTNSGTYTFTILSPVGALLQLNATNTASSGDVDYVQLTFTSTTGGDYFITSYDNLSDPPQTGTNTFTLK